MSTGAPVYLDPKLAAAVIIADERGILLQQRAMEPRRGLWTFPSGYVDRGEQVERAAEREVREELGLSVRLTHLLGIYSEPGNPVASLSIPARSSMTLRRLPGKRRSARPITSAPTICRPSHSRTTRRSSPIGRHSCAMAGRYYRNECCGYPARSDALANLRWSCSRP